MELAKNGSLKNVIQKILEGDGPKDYTNTSRQIILVGVARGMKYLHDRNIIHRDLKTDNILLDEDFHPHITDFGLSKFIETGHTRSQTKFGGTLQYEAPEILQGLKYDQKVDVYAFAILMFEVLTDSVPYPELEKEGFNAFKFTSNIIKKNYRPKFTFPIKKSFKNLIERCWSKNPEVLVTSDGLLKGVGDNRNGQISATLKKKVIDHFTKFYINDSNGCQLTAISAVCYYKGTLYMLSKRNENRRQLVLCDCKINGGSPVFLDIGNHQPVSLFGGYVYVAAIGSEGEVIFINRRSVKTSPNSPIVGVSLPEGEKASSIALCSSSIVVLSLNGRVFTSPIEEKSNVLNFSAVLDLSDQIIVWLSGTFDHFLAVSKKGQVFGYGSNAYGQLSLNKEIRSVSTFTKISSLVEFEIKEAYAGFNHSLFVTREGKIISCGDNYYEQLLLSNFHHSKGKNPYAYSPQETTITSGAAFCIAGCNISVVFIGRSPPPNAPNMPINE